MANWKHSVPIADILDLDDPAAAGLAIADRVEKELRFSMHRDSELKEILRELRTPACVIDVEEFNYTLDRLYDWGDAGHRLFLDSFRRAVV